MNGTKRKYCKTVNNIVNMKKLILIFGYFVLEFTPRSPDSTPLDFYLWGTLKNTVYATKPQTMEELRVQF